MSFTDSDYRQKGLDAYLIFHNVAVGFPDNYNYSYQEAVNYLDGQQSTFFVFLGRAILNPPQVDDATVSYKMSQLATTNQGKLPSQISEFLKAFQGSTLDEYTWQDSVKAVISGVEDAGVTVAQNVGNFSTSVVSNAASSLETIAKLLPYILVLGAGLYLFTKGGGLLQLKEMRGK